MTKLDPLMEDRYRFIDFLLLFKGRFTRDELVKRFSIGEATASRSIASFLDNYPGLVEYLGPRRGYTAKQGFTPTYTHSSLNGLEYLSLGAINQTVDVKCYGTPVYTIYKDLDILAVSAITRAVVNQREASIEYVSTTSGTKTRSVAPHSVFRAGGAWYFRAYDFNSYEFRTFKFSRLKSAYDMGLPDSQNHLPKKDDSWNRMRIAQLIPHPRNPQPDAQFLDLGVKDGDTKDLIVSEACLGFVLTDLRVDCSKGHKLSCYEYPLALKNRDELESVESMSFAPGFNDTKTTS